VRTYQEADRWIPPPVSVISTADRTDSAARRAPLIPKLWFDTQAEEAARFYTSVIPNSRSVHIAHYTETGPREPGTVMTVEFELTGQRFTGIDGRPEFTFDEAVSFQITSRTRTSSTDPPHHLRSGRVPVVSSGPV
jgi:hypothetical protein